MKNSYKHLCLVTFCLVGVFCQGCNAPEAPPKGDDAPPPESEYTIPIPEEYLKKAQEYYQKAIDSGEQVPGGVKDWVEKDLSSIGDWEYKILESEEEETEKLAGELNALGEERWECFHVEDAPGGKRFYFKKEKRSYMRNASGLFKFIPLPGGSGGS